MLSMLLVVAVVQGSQGQAPVRVAKVEVSPASAEIQVGQTIRFEARALDAQGQPVARAQIGWFMAGDVGAVDDSGRFTGGYQGHARVTAVAYIRGAEGQTLGDALVHVLPEAPARVVVDPVPTTVAAGTRLTLSGTAFSAQGDRRSDPVTFSSSNPRVVSVSPEGRLRAVALGRATIT
ncbi:MAG: Ig-like domain-containing protein, partial [Gemmatimonadales bacterium]